MWGIDWGDDEYGDAIYGLLADRDDTVDLLAEAVDMAVSGRWVARRYALGAAYWMLEALMIAPDLGAIGAITMMSAPLGRAATRSIAGGASTGSGRFLKFHESAGGHTIARHVGRSDAQLLRRFTKQPYITGSSTFTNVHVAERVIARTIRAKRAEIQQWLRQTSGSKTLDLPYEGVTTIGRGIAKGQRHAKAMTDAVVRLKKKPSGGYIILTAYPTK